jgi:UDP-2,3-diacylglucosamine pyrophosphatase LpxH
VFISDVPLGFRGRQAELLLDCLRGVECRTPYLVGDIIACWNLRNGSPWHPMSECRRPTAWCVR